MVGEVNKKKVNKEKNNLPPVQRLHTCIECKEIQRKKKEIAAHKVNI